MIYKNFGKKGTTNTPEDILSGNPYIETIKLNQRKKCIKIPDE